MPEGAKGTTGNASEYEQCLKAMGAAEASDEVFASICYYPITDLNHAYMEYEWLYGWTDNGVRILTHKASSERRLGQFPGHIPLLSSPDDGKGHIGDIEQYEDHSLPPRHHATA